MTLQTTRRGLLIGTLGIARLAPGAKTPARTIRLPLRTRVEAFKGSGLWEETRFEKDFPVAETGLLICDMWDNHWCSGAAHRVNALVKVMAPVVDQARAAGVQIIHSPSDVMAFYKDYPQRQRMLALPQVAPPAALDLSDPPLPIDDAKGGCDTSADKFYKAWSRQHAAIRIAAGDAISDQGQEVYSLLKKQGIANLLVMGVHTNMCVLKRTFAIRQMTKWGIRCVLVRDLTDSMYDPQTSPYVSHEQGTELVVQHIEKYWCPSVVSPDLTRALRA
jgi:nicotinamidase-related amidase